MLISVYIRSIFEASCFILLTCHKFCTTLHGVLIWNFGWSEANSTMYGNCSLRYKFSHYSQYTDFPLSLVSLFSMPKPSVLSLRPGHLLNKGFKMCFYEWLTPNSLVFMPCYTSSVINLWTCSAFHYFSFKFTLYNCFIWGPNEKNQMLLSHRKYCTT